MSTRRDFLRIASGAGIAACAETSLPRFASAQTAINLNVHYIDPTATAPGDGTLVSPFRSWTSVSWAPGHTYLQKRGTSYAGLFQVAASGTASQPITIGAYYRPDGSDDTSRPKPVIILPSAPVTPLDGAAIAVHNQERDFITYRNLDIRNSALPEASDLPLIWLGNHCVFENNKLTSNCSGLYIFTKSHVTVANCVFDVISNSPAYSNQGILVATNGSSDDIRLLNNTVRHLGGGTASSHGIRCETYNDTASLSHLVIRQNRVSPATGVDYNPNRRAIGIYLAKANLATLDRNTVSGMLAGIFISGGDGCYVGNNNCSNNMNFGIHIGGTAKSYIIEKNVCNNNGGNFGPTWYGRGIELTSAAGAGAVSGHTIRYNTCRFNRNYGGPLDNGSEGVGIGIDNGVSKCSVYGNIVSNNEGNGIQVYGGGDPARWPDTGGHTISYHIMDDNCSFSVLNRRGGGKTPSSFQAHVSLTYIYGSRTVVSNNAFLGKTQMTVYTDGTDANVVVAGKK